MRTTSDEAPRHSVAEGGRGNGSSIYPAGRVERSLRKPSAAWTAADLVRFVEEQGMRLITLLHVGGDESLKALDFVPRNRRHLEEILSAGERCDGSSLFTGLPAGSSDILLKPRVDTAFVNPFSSVPALALMCGHADRAGVPLPLCPGTIVRAAYQRVREELGVDLWALGEVEYFLGRQRTPRDGERSHDRGYHATSPMVFGEPLRRRAQLLLSGMGVPVKYAHGEVGLIGASQHDDTIWEQHEIELALAPLPAAAESVVLTRWVLKNLAFEEGMECRFDPILKEGHAGSGLHVHCLPRGPGNEESVLDERGNLVGPGRWLVGGLVEMAGALMAFGNGEHGSLARLHQGKEAPGSVTWGHSDRRALIRLPAVPNRGAGVSSGATVEFRLPDGTARPHVLLAGMAQALICGRDIKELDRLLERTSSTAPTAAGDLPLLPHGFSQVAATLEAHRGILEAGGVFPPAVIDEAARSLSALI